MSITENKGGMMDQDFQVGDKVTCWFHGEGEVIGIAEKGDYTVAVKFRDLTEFYTSEGVLIRSQPRRVLYHGHNLKIDIQEKPPVRHQWANVYLNNGFPFCGQPKASKEECLRILPSISGQYITTIQLKPGTYK